MQLHLVCKDRRLASGITMRIMTLETDRRTGRCVERGGARQRKLQTRMINNNNIDLRATKTQDHKATRPKDQKATRPHSGSQDHKLTDDSIAQRLCGRDHKP